MRTVLLMIAALGKKVINGNCDYRASFHRLNILGGGGFVVCEERD